MSRTKRVIAAVLVLCLVFSCLTATSFAAKGVVYESPTSDYKATKITHPEYKQGELDGLIDYESGDPDRGQSYAWSAIGYGDYIYVGTCYAAVYSTMVQMKKTNPNMDLEGLKKASDIAYNGALYMGDMKNNPSDANRSILVRINTKTGETKIVDGPRDMGGYRAAVEFKDKLYFACACSAPSPYLLEVDPNNNDATKKVYVCEKPSDRTISVGIRGLTVAGDKLISSAIGNDGAYIVASENPTEGQDSFKVIATQQDLLDYPAYHYNDDIFGGSIWDMVYFNNKLYFTVVTGKKGMKRSFAMFCGEEKENGEWEYKLLVGDKDKGAKYPFGLGNERSGASNIIVHGDYIYMGSYNDPMINIPAAVFKLDFTNLYKDLAVPAQIWRMDKNENFELVVGEPNEYFPEVKGNMPSGFGNHMNQYIWRMASYNGKLYAGTIDLGSVLMPVTEVLNGDVINMSPEELSSRLNYLKEFIKYIASKYDVNSADTLKVKNDTDKLVGILKDMKPLLNKGGVDNIKASEQFYKLYKSATAIYKKISKFLPEDARKGFDLVFNDDAVHNFYCFTQVSKFLVESHPGFDLAVTSDGVNFEMITRDGMGDKYNHGLRTFAINDNGLFCGTANPFYGAQVWHIEDKDEAAKPVEPNEDNTVTPATKPDASEAPTQGEADKLPEEVPNTGVATTSIAIAASALTAGVVLTLINKKKKEF